MLNGWLGNYGLYWGMTKKGSFDLGGYDANGDTDLTDYTIVNLTYDFIDNIVTANVDNTTAQCNITGTTYENYTIGCSMYTSSNKVIGNVYYHKFTDINGKVIQDLRPYVDSNGVACFKDVVTDTLFYNSGTGSLSYIE